MTNIDLRMASGIGYDEAEIAARKAAEEAGKGFSLLAWYDKARKMGSPLEACSLENWKCVRDYAEHRDADLRVAVNGDEYEFFFSRAPEDVTELEGEGISETHMGIAQDEFNNVQGG